MAFKTINSYNEEKNKDFFVLSNDGDFADVVFLYRSTDDVLVGDVHYIKSSEYNGYAHCCGAGCPACNYPTKDGKGIRLQPKLFIPIYNIEKDKIEFWDRTMVMEPQLQKDVFANYPDPSQYVFRITRHGEAGDRNTRYEIRAIGKNSTFPYEGILAKFNATMPEYYEHACRSLSVTDMSRMLATNNAAPVPTSDYNYVPVPRGAQSAGMPDVNTPIPEPVSVPVPTTFSEPPADLPDSDDDSDDSLDEVDF